MSIQLNEKQIPYVTEAYPKEQDSTLQFLNEFINIIEQDETDGMINYYVDNELDFDTPEEYHRH